MRRTAFFSLLLLAAPAALAAQDVDARREELATRIFSETRDARNKVVLR